MSQVFFLPTRVFSGPECVKSHSAVFRTLGTKALLVTGRRSAKLNGAGTEIAEALTSQGIPSILFDRISPNPGFAEVREAAEIVRNEGIDFVVGVGGGSPLDASKAIAVLAVNDLDEESIFLPPFGRSPLPIAAVPTTAGTGSEVTPYAILTNDRAQSKSSISHESLFPRVAFLDARYTYDLPRTVTVNTALDALSHLVEGFLAVRATSVSDLLALQGLNLLGAALRSLVSEAEVPSKGLRERLFLASATAGMVIAHTGTTAGHALGYPLTYFKNIDHGRANALSMFEYLTFLSTDHSERVGRILEALGVGDLKGLGSLINSLLGERESLTEEEILKFTSIVLKAPNLKNTLSTLSAEVVARLYRRSLPL